MDTNKSPSEVSIRELLRSLSVAQAWSLLIAVAGVLTAVFVLGTKLNAYRLERLQDRVAFLEEELERLGPPTAEQTPASSSIHGEHPTSQQLATQLTTSTPVGYSHLEFSQRRRPFPRTFDAVLPGSPLSEATRVHPGGTMTSAAYSVDIPNGPFDQVGFRHGYSAQPDPPIRAVHFFFREPSFRAKILADSLAEFGPLPHRSENLGLRVVWPNIDGFELAIDDSTYTIELSAPEPPP